MCLRDSQSVSMSLGYNVTFLVLTLAVALCSNSSAPASSSLFHYAIVSSLKSLPSGFLKQFYF